MNPQTVKMKNIKVVMTKNNHTSSTSRVNEVANEIESQLMKYEILDEIYEELYSEEGFYVTS